MSEQHEAFHDGNTPVDRLARYRWMLTDPESKGGIETAETVYVDALLGFTNLLEALGVDDAHERNIIAGGLVPGPFELHGDFDDWLIQLRLLPIRLLDKELPALEEYEVAYIDELFASALFENPEHGAECLDVEREGEACERAPTCPARVASDIGLRRLGLLLFDIHTLVVPDEANILHKLQENIEQLTSNLKEYGLVDERGLTIVTNDIHRLAADLDRAIIRPQHRKQE